MLTQAREVIHKRQMSCVAGSFPAGFVNAEQRAASTKIAKIAVGGRISLDEYTHQHRHETHHKIHQNHAKQFLGPGHHFDTNIAIISPAKGWV